MHYNGENHIQNFQISWEDPGGEGFPDSPGKSQVTICFLKNNGTDLLENPLDPLGPMAFRGRSVPPTVKVDY